MFRYKRLRSLLTVCLVVVAAILTQRFCRKQTDSFANYKILSHLDHHPEWETSPLSEEELTDVKQILQQPFHYLGRGAQVYVFASEDGTAVIKFFRLYHLLPPFWTKLPLPSFLEDFRLAKIAQKEGELERDFISYKIAFEEMRQETGLLYVHLNKTHNLNQKIRIFDKLNICHELNLDQMEFLVQKKADLVYPALDKMAKTEGIEVAREALFRLVDLLVLRSKKGIFDKDPDLNTNFGFIGREPVQIDVGRYRILEGRGPGFIDRDEIIRITDNLDQWLQAHHPELSSALREKIAEI